MKLHLPLFLYRSLLTSLTAVWVALGCGSAVADVIHSDKYIYVSSSSPWENNDTVIVDTNGSTGVQVSGVLNNRATIDITVTGSSATGSTGIDIGCPIYTNETVSLTNSSTGYITVNSAQIGIRFRDDVGKGDFDNYGTITLRNNEKGIYMSGKMRNHGTMDISASDIGIECSSYYHATIINNKDALIKISAGQQGFYGDLINYGTVDIKTGDGDGVYGVAVDDRVTNYGTLKTDSIRISGSEMLFMDGSSVGAHTAGKTLWVGNDSYYYRNILILGGVLNESENKVYRVEGGSHITVSSDIEITGVQMKLFDDSTLTMQGNLTIDGNVSTQWNNNQLTIDNGGTAHTVTWGDTFKASWDKGLALVDRGSLTSGMGATWAAGKEGEMAQNLTLHSGNLTLYTKDSTYFKIPNITLESGTLTLRADDSTAGAALADATITWAPTAGTTPLLKMSFATEAQPMTIHVDSTKLDISRLSAQGQQILDVGTPKKLQFAGTGIKESAEALFDTANGLYNYHGYQKWVDTASASSPSFWANTSTGVVIYQNDLYYSPQSTQRQKLLDGSAKNWKGGSFVVYDAEKNSYNNAASDVFVNDSSYCALAVGLNMAEYWLDSYAVLNTSTRPLPYLSTKTPSASSLNGRYSSGLYDIYAQAWINDKTHENGQTRYALGWILSGNLHGGDSSESLRQFHGGDAPFAQDTWNLVNSGITGQQSFTAQDGKIYDFHDADGIINDASANITQIITQAFGKSDAPISIGWDGIVSGTDGTGEKESGKHVVTCWGYETALVNGQTVVSKLWYTDSDDKNQSAGGQHLRSYDVIYGDDNRVYLVDTASGASVGGNPAYLTDITFMTTPAGMDDMLDDYYDKSKPIYWTGTNSVWKKDDIGGRESQTRLATLSDGWRKECVGGGRSIWAYTTFSGSGEEVIFGDAVNGVAVENKQVAVARNIKAGRVTIEGEGYVWQAKDGSATVDAQSLELKKGSSLALSGGLELTTRDSYVSLTSGSSLDNQGLIDGIVYMEAGSTFTSGCIAVTQGEDSSSAVNISLGGGLYAHVDNRGLTENSYVVFMEEGSWLNPYTLGTTIDFGGALLSRDSYNEVIEASRLTFETLAASGIFAHDFSAEHINYVFTAINGRLADSAANMAATTTCIDGNAVTISGSTAQELTIGSYMHKRDESAANILFAELLAGSMEAREAGIRTLAGDRTYINAESSAEAQCTRVVAGSELENDGALRGAIEVEGTLSGSGSFGSTTAYEGASIVIGNSPGAAEYESLTLKRGAEIDFSVDGVTPAGETTSGWGSGTHSVLTFTTPAGLVLEEGAEVNIGFSADFLASATIGKTYTLTLIQGVVADEALLAALQEATGFYYAGLDDSLSPLEESTLYSVHAFAWQAGEGDSLALQFTLYYAGEGALVVPEPATATLSLLALASLAARRRRK